MKFPPRTARAAASFCALLTVVSLTTACGPSSDFKATLTKAKAGDSQAQLDVGLLYLRGTAVSQSDTEGVNWVKQAAQSGLAAAQRTYGLMLRDGAGANRNPAQGREWLEKAAHQNDAAAQAELAGMLGVFSPPFEPIEAMKWALLAEKNGATNGAALQKIIAVQLTASQLAEARSKASEFVIDK